MSDLIHEYEPLNWLVSSLFTDKFITNKSNFSPFEFPDGDHGKAGEEAYLKEFEKYQLYLEQIELFVNSNIDASDCAENAIKAMKTGSIKIPGSSISDTGGFISPFGYEYASTRNFYLWASSVGYPIPAQTAFIIDEDRQKLHELENTFPTITIKQFEQKEKEPVWHVGDGILYLLKRRRRNAVEKDQTTPELFFKQSYLAAKVLQYAEDAFASNDLIPINDNADLLLKTVKPEEFILWAKSLPVDLPIFFDRETHSHNTTYATLDMLLMNDAVNKFWSNYDLKSPDLRRAPYKKDVVSWLMLEAEKRKILGFSKTRAELMDTIIRCPKSRAGGNA